MPLHIRRVSTPEVIVEHLLTSIRRGKLRPGDRLPSERTLQAQLGVGRLALREALARLSALGVIRVEHGRGVFVQGRVHGEAISRALTPLLADRDPRKLQELVQARELIEGEVAALAAVRRTKADIRRLQAILDRPVASGDGVALAELDYEFHREVARIAGNEFLTVMLDALADPIRGFLLRYVQAMRDPQSIVDRHRPIVEAIIKGDAQLARQCTCKHIKICKSSLEESKSKRKSHHA